MFRISEKLAKEIISKIKDPEIVLSGLGNDLFTIKSKTIGLIDPVCCICTEADYILESPIPLIYPDLSYIPVNINGYFLYKKEELLVPMESWQVTRALLDPTCQDFETKIEASDCSVVLPNDIEKLTCKTINTMEQLIKFCPTIIDSLNLEKN